MHPLILCQGRPRSPAELLTPPLSPSSLCSTDSDSTPSPPASHKANDDADVVIVGELIDWIEQTRVLLDDHSDDERPKSPPYSYFSPSTDSLSSFHTTTETIVAAPEDEEETPRWVPEEPVVQFRISTAGGPWRVRPQTAAQRAAAYEVGIEELQQEGPTWWNDYCSLMKAQGFPSVAPVRRTRRVPVAW